MRSTPIPNIECEWGILEHKFFVNLQRTISIESRDQVPDETLFGEDYDWIFVAIDDEMT